MGLSYEMPLRRRDHERHSYTPVGQKKLFDDIFLSIEGSVISLIV